LRGLSEYLIGFEGLKQGTHFYEFNVDNKFFEEFDCKEFNKSTFKVELEFVKQSTMMLLKFNFKGIIAVPCDRCLDIVDITVKGEEKLIIKFGNELYEETDEILILPIHEHELNVAKYIYEFINLNLPQKRTHPKGLCNKGVIKEFEKLEKKNDIEVDPRWSTLQNINLKKNN
jgi:uncharacterized metal-binding protein YceD (DUF177 family)